MHGFTKITIFESDRQNSLAQCRLNIYNAYTIEANRFLLIALQCKE